MLNCGTIVKLVLLALSGLKRFVMAGSLFPGGKPSVVVADKKMKESSNTLRAHPTLKNYSKKIE